MCLACSKNIEDCGWRERRDVGRCEMKSEQQPEPNWKWRHYNKLESEGKRQIEP